MNLRAEAAVEETAPDTLLESLMVLTRLAQRALSAEALRAGLPLEGGRLSVELVPRAAARAGLLARARPLRSRRTSKSGSARSAWRYPR